MLDEIYLVRGLDALARAHERDFFSDGHRGAAVIAAYYLAHEQALAPATHEVIAESLRSSLKNNDLFEPILEQSAPAEMIESVVETLSSRIGVFKMVGHDVIFTSAALKAFRQVPDAITPQRVRGICALIECFDTAESDDVPPAENVPELADDHVLTEFIFREFLGSLARFKGFGQGWAGHLLTFSHALIELKDMGYVELANAGRSALATQVSIIRRGPSKGDRRIPDHERSRWRPVDFEYWEKKRPSLSGLGHVFKYPYSYYNLINRLDNQELREQCNSECYQIF